MKSESDWNNGVDWDINKNYAVQEPFFKKISTTYNYEKPMNTYLKYNSLSFSRISFKIVICTFLPPLFKYSANPLLTHFKHCFKLVLLMLLRSIRGLLHLFRKRNELNLYCYIIAKKHILSAIFCRSGIWRHFTAISHWCEPSLKRHP